MNDCKSIGHLSHKHLYVKFLSPCPMEGFTPAKDFVGTLAGYMGGSKSGDPSHDPWKISPQDWLKKPPNDKDRQTQARPGLADSRYHVQGRSEQASKEKSFPM